MTEKYLFRGKTKSIFILRIVFINFNSYFFFFFFFKLRPFSLATFMIFYTVESTSWYLIIIKYTKILYDLITLQLCILENPFSMSIRLNVVVF